MFHSEKPFARTAAILGLALGALVGNARATEGDVYRIGVTGMT